MRLPSCAKGVIVTLDGRMIECKISDGYIHVIMETTCSPHMISLKFDIGIEIKHAEIYSRHYISCSYGCILLAAEDEIGLDNICFNSKNTLIQYKAVDTNIAFRSGDLTLVDYASSGRHINREFSVWITES
jgi:DUF1680 family protein